MNIVKIAYDVEKSEQNIINEKQELINFIKTNILNLFDSNKCKIQENNISNYEYEINVDYILNKDEMIHDAQIFDYLQKIFYKLYKNDLFSNVSELKALKSIKQSAIYKKDDLWEKLNKFMEYFEKNDDEIFFERISIHLLYDFDYNDEENWQFSVTSSNYDTFLHNVKQLQSDGFFMQEFGEKEKQTMINMTKDMIDTLNSMDYK